MLTCQMPILLFAGTEFESAKNLKGAQAKKGEEDQRMMLAGLSTTATFRRKARTWCSRRGSQETSCRRTHSHRALGETTKERKFSRHLSSKPAHAGLRERGRAYFCCDLTCTEFERHTQFLADVPNGTPNFYVERAIRHDSRLSLCCCFCCVVSNLIIFY